jgi:hypothetical protein
MLKTKLNPDMNGREITPSIMLVAIKDIPLTITVDPVTGEDTWHPPKNAGEVFEFPKKNGRVLIKRRLAKEFDDLVPTS